ncbi:MAG TPA: PKD domain-containing protein, partial [Patescibacteria group bacterium]|nr:PKD domain-containing protein [Patescibacteria group bacterium]
YVVSIPNVYQLWNLFKGSWWARFIWSTADICQSLLANPTSNQQPDIDRREAVRQRNIAYNAELAQVCALHSRCRFDGNAVFNTIFTSSDVSGDYFHPSIAGQAKLAGISWAAGYSWSTGPTPNEPPTASFTFECANLVCAFTDGSSDGDGLITAYQWGFGDGTGSTAENPTHTYTAGGTYTVSLRVTDDDGAVATTSQDVTVSTSEPPPPDPEGTMSVADLDGSSSAGKGQAWTASVAIRVIDDGGSSLAGATVTGDWGSGGSSSCTTDSIGWCTVSASVNAKKATSTTFTVTGLGLAGFTYVPADNGDPDGDSNGTTITVARQ